MPSVSVEGAKATALFVVILVLAVGALAGHYTLLQRENARLTEAKGRALAEKKRLEGVKAQYDQVQRKSQELQRKFDIIHALTENQTGPVIMLNTLASTVEASGPVWLTSFTNDGTTVKMDGVAVNVNAVANFITNLKHSGYFKNVEIQQSYEDASSEVSTFVFAISAEIVPTAPASGKAAPGAKS
jgi:type IV pilus assembly protein PilN